MKNSQKQEQQAERLEEEVLTSDEVVKVEIEEVLSAGEENETMETIIIDDEDVEFKDSDEEENLKTPPKKSSRDFVKEVKELSEDESEKVEKILADEEKEKENAQVKTVDLLTKFKEYISRDKFNKKCENVGSKYNLKGTVVKNSFVKNTLGTIADILNLTVTIIGDVILGVSNFINVVISNIATYAAKTLHKVINILTLNCGDI